MLTYGSIAPELYLDGGLRILAGRKPVVTDRTRSRNPIPRHKVRNVLEAINLSEVRSVYGREAKIGPDLHRREAVTPRPRGLRGRQGRDGNPNPLHVYRKAAEPLGRTENEIVRRVSLRIAPRFEEGTPKTFFHGSTHGDVFPPKRPMLKSFAALRDQRRHYL